MTAPQPFLKGSRGPELPRKAPMALGPGFRRGSLFACAAAAMLFGAATFATAQGAKGVDDAVVTADALPPKLSAFGFFTDLAARTPAARVTPYQLNTPLFSDYTDKHRYLYVPAGAKLGYDPKGVLAFPVGAALIKTFGYGEGAGFKPIETRLLLRRASGWVALPYVWDADGRDATLRRAGTRLPVTFTDPVGQTRTISYGIPNVNQCKDCHALSNVLTPIGPTARNLNDGRQLEQLHAAGLLDRLPADAPRLARWNDPKAPLDARARAYLEVNCAHCHNPRGAASNSGLFLQSDQPDATARGLLKPPVAAGRGSGGRMYAIVPGKPDESILLHRMGSTEPGVAMPELGRTTNHDQALAMLREWITAMPAK